MLEDLIAITLLAHQEILDVYNSNFTVDKKADNTPITDADRRANGVIMDGLSRMDSSIPILSEEEKIPPFEERQQWDKYWIVDPLDGTREFTERHDEFTVNIALVESGIPKLGVVGIPTKAVIYTGEVDRTIALRHTRNAITPISTSPASERIRMTMSRHYKTKRNQKIVDYLVARGEIVEIMAVGSSIKMCYIAEGRADIYVRFGPSNEWDIAAAHAVLSAAGGGLYLLDGARKCYNQLETTANPAFFACSSRPHEWTEIIASSGVLDDDK